jgi:hypothetical protein
MGSKNDIPVLDLAAISFGQADYVLTNKLFSINLAALVNSLRSQGVSPIWNRKLIDLTDIEQRTRMLPDFAHCSLRRQYFSSQ